MHQFVSLYFMTFSVALSPKPICFHCGSLLKLSLFHVILRQ